MRAARWRTRSPRAPPLPVTRSGCARLARLASLVGALAASRAARTCCRVPRHRRRARAASREILPGAYARRASRTRQRGRGIGWDRPALRSRRPLSSSEIAAHLRSALLNAAVTRNDREGARAGLDSVSVCLLGLGAPFGSSSADARLHSRCHRFRNMHARMRQSASSRPRGRSHSRTPRRLVRRSRNPVRSPRRSRARRTSRRVSRVRELGMIDPLGQCEAVRARPREACCRRRASASARSRTSMSMSRRRDARREGYRGHRRCD